MGSSLAMAGVRKGVRWNCMVVMKKVPLTPKSPMAMMNLTADPSDEHHGDVEDSTTDAAGQIHGDFKEVATDPYDEPHGDVEGNTTDPAGQIHGDFKDVATDPYDEPHGDAEDGSTGPKPEPSGGA